MSARRELSWARSGLSIKITTQLNIDNVLDKHYYASSQNSASNGIFPGAPLTFLGSVKIEF